MNLIYKRALPAVEEVLREYAPGEALLAKKRARDEEIAAVCRGESARLLVIVGPCSADHEDAVHEYVCRLSKVQEKTADRLILIPRIYTNEPRTTCEGYKGILHQPDPEKKPDLIGGLFALRRMHLRCLADTGLSAADEMLYPENHVYLDELLAYIAVGARSVEDQQHRLTASGISLPVGMKNPTSGDFSVMLNSITAAQQAHEFIYRGREAQTAGNPLAHAILRGAVNKHGQSIPNYHYEDLTRLAGMYGKRGLRNPMIIIDANHANSDKRHDQQPRIVREVMGSRRANAEIRRLVRGFMIESYLQSGAAPIGGHEYGKSITDPCLGFSETEELLYEMAELAV